MSKRLKSRKLWVSIVTAVVMLVSAILDVELDTKQIISIVLPVVGYVLGESLIDLKKR